MEYHIDLERRFDSGYYFDLKKKEAVAPPPGFTLTAHTEAAVAEQFIPPIAMVIVSYLIPAIRPPKFGEYNNIRYCKSMYDARRYWHNRVADFATAGFFEPCHRALYSAAPEDEYIRDMCHDVNNIVVGKFAANGYLAAVQAIMAIDYAVSPDIIAVAAARSGHIDIIRHIIDTGVEFEAAEAISAAKAAGHPAIIELLSMYSCSAAALYDDERD